VNIPEEENLTVVEINTCEWRVKTVATFRNTVGGLKTLLYIIERWLQSQRVPITPLYLLRKTDVPPDKNTLCHKYCGGISWSRTKSHHSRQ